MRQITLPIFAILTIFLLTGLSMPSCGKKTEPTSTETVTTSTPTPTLNDVPLGTVDAATYDSQITQIYDLASAEATKWQNNAELVMVSVRLPADFALNSATQTYTYGSSNEAKYWWTYSYDEQTKKFVRALVNKDDYLGANLKAIPKHFWRTNYIEAFQIAQNYGGQEFIANNPNSQVTETLSISEPKGWLWWTVEYKTPTGNSLTVRINPNDRTIVNEAGETIATGKVYSPQDIYSQTGTEPTLGAPTSDTNLTTTYPTTSLYPTTGY